MKTPVHMAFAIFYVLIATSLKINAQNPAVVPYVSGIIPPIQSIPRESRKNIFALFPNPAKDQVQIVLDEFSQSVIMILYDNSGNDKRTNIGSAKHNYSASAAERFIFYLIK